MSDDAWQGHLNDITDCIIGGNLVLFLGPDVNLCDRQDRTDLVWNENSDFPPSNNELSRYLGGLGWQEVPDYRQEVRCPYAEAQELKQLPPGCPLREGDSLTLPIQNFSQYIATRDNGDTALYHKLNYLFSEPHKYKPNSLHQFLASLPALLKQKCQSPHYPLIVTTCFDGALEQAFKNVGEPVDVVGFVGDASDPSLGRFHHVTPDGLSRPILAANQYGTNPQDGQLNLSKQPVILKLYRGYRSNQFLITEDHFIDYLSQVTINSLVPSNLMSILNADGDGQLLFIGYSLNAWNQRVILRRLWQNKRNVTSKSWWAIQATPDALDTRMWRRYSVTVLQRPKFKLQDYIAAIQERLEAKPALAPVIASASGASSERNKVFFSYSHKDKEWLEKIKTVLNPLFRSNQLSEWDDQQIEAGDKWREEIKNALASAKVGVLLVSQSFLKSEFIMRDELPVLLETAEKKELILIPVFIEPCLYEYTALREYQTIPEPSRSLIQLNEGDCQEALVMIARKIKELFDRK